MKIFLAALVFILLPTEIASANLRDKIKEHMLEKQKEKPAPKIDPATSSIDKAGDYTLSIEVSGQTRYYKIHVPKSYVATKASPLLLVLHGGGGDMSIQSDDKFYKQISKSEEEGFIAVFPNGTSAFASGKLATWNAGKCCGQARDKEVDDVAFIRETIQKTKSQLNIDPQRIFATGMSNGGMMSYRLACEMPETFRAIAAVAGTDNTVSCKPGKAISILHIHAKDDDHVLFNGGAGKDAFADRSKVTEFASVPATVSKWQSLNACTGKAKRVLETKGAYCDLSESCKDGTKVQLCVTEEGGHSWPGGKKPNAMAKAKPSTAISANDLMWEFFRSL